MFWLLDMRRSGNGYGANPISHQEIDALLRVRQITLEPWELDIIDCMENARRAHLDNQAETGNVVSSEELTPGLFRSLFC